MTDRVEIKTKIEVDNPTFRIRGRIKSLKHSYGFIEGADGIDYFFHWTMLHEATKTFKMCAVGDTVDFHPSVVEDRPKAHEIMVID